MVTRSVDVMLSKPGIYVLVAPIGVSLCEVDEDGRCWQLTLTDYSRDGELSQGGWGHHVSILGLFARAT